MVDEGRVSARQMVLILVKHMTWQEVHDALDANELTPRFEDEDEEEENS